MVSIVVSGCTTSRSLRRRKWPALAAAACQSRFKVLLCDVHLIDVQVNHQHYGACPQVQYLCVYYLLLCDEDKSQTISSQDLKAARHFGLGCAQIL